MGNHIDLAVFLTVFGVFFAGAMAAGGFTDYASDEMEDYNISDDDLKFSPSIPAPQYDKLDLENFEDSENVRIDEVGDNETVPYDVDQYLRLSNQSEEGWALYRVSGGTEILNSKVTRYGLFESSKITLEEYVTTNENATASHFLSRQQSTDLKDTTNFVRVVIDPSDDRVYELEEQTNEEKGLISTVGAYVTSFGNAIASWFKLFTGLPKALFYVGAVVSFLVIIVAAEIVLW